MNRTLRTLLAGATALMCFAQTNCFAAVKAPRASDTAALANCNWTHPGVNPFMGDLVAAVDRYADIPAPVRARLKARMAKRDYDEVVDIRRNTITGSNDYSGEITDMHFGTGQLCHQVSRTAWSDRMLERGLVYCEQDQCILVPTVCRNVSRIQRRAVHGEAMHGIFLPAAATGFPSAASMADARALPLDLAGPIGWAPVGGFAGAPEGGVAQGGVPAAQFAAVAGGVGGGGIGGGTGLSAPGSGSMPKAEVAVAGDQTARTDVSNTESQGDLVPLAPAVPEPETWALMAIGLAVVARRLVARQGRSSRAD